MDVSVEIHCATCGSSNFSLPGGAEAESPILCNDCGARMGSIDELRAQLMAQAFGQSSEALRRNLDRLS